MLHWAMAPVADEEGELPDAVRRDLICFRDGGEPELEWAQVDSYDVTRDDNA
jgi:hypothetical protein